MGDSHTLPYHDMRGLIALLESEGQLRRITRPVEARYLNTLLAQADTALLMENVEGYSIPVVGGLVGSRQRVALGLGCDQKTLGQTFMEALDHPMEAEVVADGPAQEVVKIGEEVDLTELPIPFQHRKDGGPYLSAGISVSKDAAGRRNAGCYRLMYRTPRETGIDLVSPSDMRFSYEAALKRGEPLPIAIAFGTGTPELIAAAYKAPPGYDEFAVAGALYGRPVPLVKCKTVDLEVPAHAEIVLEGEISTDGWTIDEGRYGDFTGHQCSIRWNPVFQGEGGDAPQEPDSPHHPDALGERLAGGAAAGSRRMARPPRGQHQDGRRLRHAGQRLLLAPLRRHRQAPRRREERAAGAHVAPRPEARGGHRRRRRAHRPHGGGTGHSLPGPAG